MTRDRAWEAVLRHPLIAAWLAVVGVVALGQVGLPQRQANALFIAVAVVSGVPMVVGPALHRPTVRRPYRWLLLALALFVLSIAMHIVTGRGTDWQASAAVALGGYVAGAAFLWDLLRSAQGGVDRLGLLDASVITIGAALALWSYEMAPDLFSSGLPFGRALLTICFPLVDAVIVALATRLAMQAAHRTPALWALLSGIVCMVGGDTAAFVVNPAPGSVALGWIRAPYVLTLGLMAVAMAHPTMARLGERGVVSDGRMAPARRVAMIVAVLAPSAVALLVPPVGTVDLLVRMLLLGLLLGAVQRRLMGTVAALVEAQELTRYQASHDRLTGLPNRQAFLADVRDRIEAAPPGHWVGVVGVDVDRFTQVNDTWGHPVGDELLRVLAGRLAAVAAPDRAVFRTSGDEFAVVVTGSGPQDGRGLVERARAAVAEPFLLDGDRRVTLTVTAGVAHADAGTGDAAELVRDADTALSRAKQDGAGGTAVFDESLRARVHDRLLLAEGLRVAVGRGELDAHFQPIHAGAGPGTGYRRLVGFEALARWNHPERGMVPPGVFIPLSEDNGTIIEIGEFMMRRACSQLAAWRAASGADLHVSVNVSLAQITGSDVPAMVAGALAASGLPAEAVWVEITESLMADRDGAVLGTLRRLKELGVTLALDDFGTGYSSLSCIGDFPIDVVKVDRSFVSRLGQDARTTALTQVIIDMARSLGLTGVVAEGVEEAAQGEALARMGCTWVQGYHYGRPQPAADVDLSAAVAVAAAPGPS